MTQADPSLRQPPAKSPLEALIANATELLREFGGRVLPTCSTPSNGKLPHGPANPGLRGARP